MDDYKLVFAHARKSRGENHACARLGWTRARSLSALTDSQEWESRR